MPHSARSKTCVLSAIAAPFKSWSRDSSPETCGLSISQGQPSPTVMGPGRQRGGLISGHSRRTRHLPSPRVMDRLFVQRAPFGRVPPRGPCSEAPDGGLSRRVPVLVEGRRGCRLGGARRVVVLEPNPDRRTRVEQQGHGASGLDIDVDPLEAGDRVTRTRGGFDVAFECSGALQALTTLVRCAGTEGTVVAVGLVNGDLPLSVNRTLITRGLTLRGSFGRSMWATWEQLTALVVAGKVDLESLITHRLPLDALPAALDLMRGDAGKILLLPSFITTAQGSGLSEAEPDPATGSGFRCLVPRRNRLRDATRVVG